MGQAIPVVGEFDGKIMKDVKCIYEIKVVKTGMQIGPIRTVEDSRFSERTVHISIRRLNP